MHQCDLVAGPANKDIEQRAHDRFHCKLAQLHMSELGLERACVVVYTYGRFQRLQEGHARTGPVRLGCRLRDFSEAPNSQRADTG
jgi:hypothetical protein